MDRVRHSQVIEGANTRHRGIKVQLLETIRPCVEVEQWREVTANGILQEEIAAWKDGIQRDDG